MSAARERAGRALFNSQQRKEPFREMVCAPIRASLDENDIALIAAIARAVEAYMTNPEVSYEGIAWTAIIAARNHITGGGA